MPRTRRLRYPCAFALAVIAVLSLGVAATATARPARTKPVLPSLTPLIVSATGGGSLTPMKRVHAGRVALPSITPKIVSATGGGSITPLPAAAVTATPADPESRSPWPLATPIVAAGLVMVWLVMKRRRRRRPAIQVTMG